MGTGIACPYCGKEAPQVTGRELYPHRPDLFAKRFYWCRPCGAYVGCHPDGKAYGRLANAELRKARGFVHGLFDPIWENARDAYNGHDNAKVRGVTRSRAYRWLASRMGIDPAACHIGMFDVEQCRQAFRILRDQKPTAVSIRQWAKANPSP